MTVLKNVVIIGAAGGGKSHSTGANTARALEKSLPPSHRIILIDAKEYAYYQISGLRAAVREGWEEMSLAPLKGFFPKDSRHIVLPLTKAIQISSGFVVVDRAHLEHGLEDRIQYDYAVLATGSHYAAPGRLDFPTRSEGIKFLKSMQSDLETSKHVVILGGGSVGVEFAGEVKSFYPQKDITLIHGASYLINQYPPTLSASLMPQIKAMDINVILNDKLIVPKEEMVNGPIAEKVFSTTNGVEITADYLFVATGNKVEERLVSRYDPSAVNADGFIKTKKVQKGSTLEVDSGKLGSVFVLGDAADLYPKSGFAVLVQAPIVAANITSLIKSPSAKLKLWTGLPVDTIAVPLGPAAGSFYGLPLVGVRGRWFTSKVKSAKLFLPVFGKLYNWEPALSS